MFGQKQLELWWICTSTVGLLNCAVLSARDIDWMVQDTTLILEEMLKYCESGMKEVTPGLTRYRHS
jgi:hypothetical protein